MKKIHKILLKQIPVCSLCKGTKLVSHPIICPACLGLLDDTKCKTCHQTGLIAIKVTCPRCMPGQSIQL